MRRFDLVSTISGRMMERLAAEQHKTLKAYSPSGLEALWEAAKGETGPVQGRFTALEDN